MMNHHSILNRHQLRKVCLFCCGTSHGCPHLPLLPSNAVAFAGISTTRAVSPSLYLRVHTHQCGFHIFSWVCGFTFFVCTIERVRYILYVRVHGRVTHCLLCTLALFVPGALCLQGMLYKRVFFEPSARASEFICIHSTACLSSEPILITSRSGLLQHCTYSLSE